MGHFGRAGVRYVQWDVLGPDFLHRLESLASEVDRPVAILGMHLCGALSLRAIEAFATLESAAALVLAPCCLPSKKDTAVAPPALFESNDGDKQYAAWCSHLERAIREAVPNSCVTARTVDDILSPKNY